MMCCPPLDGAARRNAHEGSEISTMPAESFPLLYSFLLLSSCETGEARSTLGPVGA